MSHIMDIKYSYGLFIDHIAPSGRFAVLLSFILGSIKDSLIVKHYTQLYAIT